MFALLVKLHSTAREFHKPEPRVACRKLARTIQNQVERAITRLRATGLHLESLLQPDYGNPVPAQDFHDTRVAGHLGTRIKSIGTRAQACNTHDKISAARDKRPVLQQRIAKYGCRHQYTESPKRPRTRPFGKKSGKCRVFTFFVGVIQNLVENHAPNIEIRRGPKSRGKPTRHACKILTTPAKNGHFAQNSPFSRCYPIQRKRLAA